jgi:hypothetical protein
MIFGAAYSHTDMLKMGYDPSILFVVDSLSLTPNSSLITAPPTAVNNLTIPTSFSDFIDQTEDGTYFDLKPSLPSKIGHLAWIRETPHLYHHDLGQSHLPQ